MVVVPGSQTSRQRKGEFPGLTATAHGDERYGLSGRGGIGGLVLVGAAIQQRHGPGTNSGSEDVGGSIARASEPQAQVERARRVLGRV